MRHALDCQEISASELCQESLDRIRTIDPSLNSFITIDEEGALRSAEAADQRIQRQKSVHALTGIPIAHKDVLCTRKIRTTCASKMLRDFTPPYDATVVEKIAATGAVCLGKTNMDEFAMGSSSETSHFGPIRNPWNLNCVPGGSSGGMAAAIAANLVPLATGSDTGGSIRQPAAFCGVTGLRPTYGRVSRYGMVAFASSLDQCGPCARSVEDVGILLGAMEGFDPHDSTSSHCPSTDLEQDWGPRTIGIPDRFLASLESGVWNPVAQTMRVFEQMGCRIQCVELPHFGNAVAAYYLIACGEASSNLSRFDGIRFGHRIQDATDFSDLYSRSRGEGFGTEVKRRILVGAFAQSEGHQDGHFVQAQKVRRLILKDFLQAFQSVDLIYTPTTPSVAFELNAPSTSPVQMYSHDAFTVPSALAGLPAISFPCGLIGGLPIGAQLIANHFRESELLSAGRAFQRETDWHLREPELRHS